jgi:Tol biopolymer transport system component
MAPAWSLDGARIAYVAAPDAGGVAGGDEGKAAMARRKIWAMDLYSGGQYGANQRQLTNDPAYRDEAPRWSSDGSQIYFMRLDARDRWSLWVMGTDGAGARQVIDGLSPDLTGSPEQVWFGYYGLVEWSGVLDYWPNTAP